MSLIIPDGYAQLVLGFSTPNTVTGRMAIVTGWGATGAPLTTDIGLWCANIAEELDGWMDTLFDTSVTLDTVYAQTDTASVSVSTSSQGGQSFEGPPPNAATLVNYGTSYKGRRGRGRTFLYGVLGEGDVNEAGVIAGARLAAIQSNWEGVLQAIATAVPPLDINQVILQNTTPTVNPPANPSPPFSPPPIVTNVSVAGRMATQRRRLRR